MKKQNTHPHAPFTKTPAEMKDIIEKLKKFRDACKQVEWVRGSETNTERASGVAYHEGKLCHVTIETDCFSKEITTTVQPVSLIEAARKMAVLIEVEIDMGMDSIVCDEGMMKFLQEVQAT